MAGSPDDKQDEEGLKDPMVRFHSFLHGGTSSLLSTFIVFPVYKIVFRQQIHNTPVYQAVGQLYKEGPAKLFRGVTPPLLMKTLNGTLLFGLQDTLLRQLSLSSQNVISTSALPALAGFGAGMVEAVVFTPFERVQNVLQNGQNDRQLPTLKSVLVRLKAQRLALGYYRALLPITARNAFGSSLYFGLKGPVCAAMEGQALYPMVSSFISGTLTSVATSLILYPLNVLVANMQAEVGGEDYADAFSYNRTCAPLLQKSSKMSNKCPITKEVQQFKKERLNSTEVVEKNPLPTTQVIEEEKIAMEEETAKEPLNKELETFDQQVLKKTEVQEKNPLPTADVIEEEKIALEEKAAKEPLNEELVQFKTSKLRKSITKESNHRPTAAEIEAEKKAMKEGKK
ncbi:hypothetical protein PFLUV_G00121240 [Perca fluviatilis]|uniref:Solute carrier family 25 member 53 n=1 Tax=Perca fluviatilis TaxID=8168 RepID=A0A6A5ER33_PERFL|nr:hypothetical protein PFLUV_G00121240 [Perca fluviatilis]